jgi:uncharacterized protein YjbI with pentapeptide repeats
MQSSADQVQDLLDRYKLGERHFVSLEIEKGDLQGVNLQNAVFENCCLALDFRRSDLRNSRFVNSNIKTCDFREADLTEACIEGSSVEATRFKDALTDGFVFRNNHCYSVTVNQEEFEEYFKNE